MARDDLTDIVTAIRGRASGARAVILIDGRSGSGKTELATKVAATLDAQLIRLDDLYPGWDGLEAASKIVRTEILSNHRWQRWNWQSAEPAEWHELDDSRALVIEGSGALSRANRERATFGIWVDLDAVTRKARAIARDGAMYEPHWEHWAAQEERFFDRERPDLLADLVVRGI